MHAFARLVPPWDSGRSIFFFFFQQSGFVAVVDWSGFSLRQGGALGATALRNLIAALRGRFPARFKAIHFLSAPLYVQATLALVKPFLDEKIRNKVREPKDKLLERNKIHNVYSDIMLINQRY